MPARPATTCTSPRIRAWLLWIVLFACALPDPAGVRASPIAGIRGEVGQRQGLGKRTPRTKGRRATASKTRKRIGSGKRVSSGKRKPGRKRHLHRKAKRGRSGGRCMRTKRAWIRDTPAAMAGRYRLPVGQFLALNGLPAGSKLRHRKRYVIARGGMGERLVGGVSLGPSTPAYVVVKPERAWGKPFVIELLRAAAQRVMARYPGGHRIVIEDISFPGGGCMPPHQEHRGGLEVDAGLYHKESTNLRRLQRGTAANFDAPRTWLFLRSLIESGRVRHVLLDRKLQALLHLEARRKGATPAQLGKWFQWPRRRGDAVLLHVGGHDNHAHIQFGCGGSGCPADPGLPEFEEHDVEVPDDPVELSCEPTPATSGPAVP